MDPLVWLVVVLVVLAVGGVAFVAVRRGRRRGGVIATEWRGRRSIRRRPGAKGKR